MTRTALSSALRVASLTLLLASSHVACSRPSAANVSGSARIEHGRYLVETSGCNDCHTPMKLGLDGPEPDLARALSGHPEGFAVGAPPNLPPGSSSIASVIVKVWPTVLASALNSRTSSGIWRSEPENTP